MHVCISVGEMSQGRQQAFEIFKQDYHDNHRIETNKAQLREKYARAKSLGAVVNEARSVISKFWRSSYFSMEVLGDC